MISYDEMRCFIPFDESDEPDDESEDDEEELGERLLRDWRFFVIPNRSRQVLSSQRGTEVLKEATVICFQKPFNMHAY